MYGILGYLGVALFVILVAPYVLRIANKQFLGNNKQVMSAVRTIKKTHKLIGFVFLLVGGIHGFMATGGFAFLYMSGFALYLSMLITILFAILFGVKKKKIWLTLHRVGVIVTLVFLGNHILLKLF